MHFSEIIISWYRKNKRDLPWRNTRDAYRIWLSEVILQQTRVEQGLPYYYKFVDTFPTVKALAEAKEEAVLRLWQGLGYYSRARNLHAAAKDIVNRFNGKFPSDYESIRSLKGVGDYTAAAIASFAFDLPHAVADGNVFRLISRYYGIDEPIDKLSTRKAISTTVNELLSGFAPAEFNQAIMEFGAIQCKPAAPDCSVCPLNQTCFARLKNRVAELPYKEKKIKVRSRYFHYIIIQNKNHFYLRRRTNEDIWQGLHDFPLIESEKALTKPQTLKLLADSRYGSPEKISQQIKHLLSHQTIHAHFYHVNEENISDKSILKKLIRVDKKSVGKLALPRLIEKYVNENL